MTKLTSTLLIDDDNTTNFVNRILLEDMGVTEKILVARNGQEAIDLYQQQCADGDCPQLILLDVKMPVMDGFEFLEAYEKLNTAQEQLPVIVMLTTSLHPRDVERLQGMPIQGYLNKPLTKDKIQELLREHFNIDNPKKDQA